MIGSRPPPMGIRTIGSCRRRPQRPPIRARPTAQRRRSACLQSAHGSAGSLCGVLVARPGEPRRRDGLEPADFPGDSTTFPPGGPTTPASPGWPATGIPSIRTSGGLFDGLAQLAPANRYPEYALPFGGLLSPPAAPVPSSPGIGSVLSTAQPQSADPQPGSPTGRRPITDYSTGEIAADAAKSFGVGVGRVRDPVGRVSRRRP